MSSLPSSAGGEIPPSGNLPVLTGFLTQDEQDIVHAFLTADEKPEQLIPQDIPDDDLWRALQASCKALGKVNEAVGKLKPIVGRMIHLLKEKPQILELHGYSTFDQFMTKGVPKLFGISRPEAYKALKVAEVLPFLSPAEVSALGFNKADALASILRKTTTEGMPPEMLKRKREEWLDIARSGTIQELKAVAVSKAAVDKGELDFALIQIPTNKSVREQWDTFISNPLVQAYVNASNADQILACCIEECTGTWVPLAQAQLDGREK